MDVGHVPLILADPQAWARQNGHELLDVQEEGGVFKFYIGGVTYWRHRNG